MFEIPSESINNERFTSNEVAIGGHFLVKMTAKEALKLSLDPALAKKMHDLMVKSRCLEERLIKMYKQSDGYFWIGGPGEEAFNIPLGLLVKKGEGKDHDYLHLHYRSSGILVAMGMNPLDSIRQMKNVATDPFSGGRNFSNHYSIKKWNVYPVASVIENQYQTAIGTGLAQKRHGGSGITIVNGGDAGTAEGDFASCLIWSTRPDKELPVLIIVTNNQWGISTPAATQHGERAIADRAKAFGIKSTMVNGNDPEESYEKIKEAMAYVRKERRPFFIEASVSRLYGHSSASGANFAEEEDDPIRLFEQRLEKAGIMTRKEMDKVRADYDIQFSEFAKQAKSEPMPDSDSIYDYVYHKQKGKYW